MLDETIKGGQDEPFKGGQDELKYKKGGQDDKYRKGGQDELKYRRGGQDDSLRGGQDELKYRRGGQDDSLRGGQDELKYRRGGQDMPLRGGQEDKYRRGGDDEIYPFKGGQEEFRYRSRGGVRTLTNPAEISAILFRYKNQWQIYHWQTKSFARHKGADVMLDGLDSFLDTFMEAYMGKYGRPDFGAGGMTVSLVNMDDSQAVAFLEEMSTYFTNEVPKYLDEKDTDLFNIRDEILGVVNKVKYLFTLN